MQALQSILLCIGIVAVVIQAARLLFAFEDYRRSAKGDSPDWSNVDFSLARRRQNGEDA